MSSGEIPLSSFSEIPAFEQSVLSREHCLKNIFNILALLWNVGLSRNLT